jgi:NADP-dependent 3-hydroxy acid dehydrogenase YdfG
MSTADSLPVVLLAGAFDALGQCLAHAVLAAGGKVAAAVPRDWQVQKLREQLVARGATSDRFLVGVVGPRDAEAAAGFVKGANDALGTITQFVGASSQLHNTVAGREPAGDLDEMLLSNLHSNATLARAVLPTMRRRRTGNIVLASLPDPVGQLSVTCRASLAALREFAVALANDVTAHGLRVHCLPLPNDLSAIDEAHPSVAPWMLACTNPAATT